jgi:TolA-binding protein
MTKKILLFALVATALTAREPSAFDAGNLELENPYGLTQSEKVTLQNKQKLESLEQSIQELQIKYNGLNRDFSQSNEKVEGLLSVVDGSNKGMHDKLVQMQESIEAFQTQNEALQKEITRLNENHTQTVAKFNAAVTELTSIINNINKNYVDRDKFRKLEEAFFKLEKAAISPQKQSGLSGDNWQIYVDMIAFYEKQEYDEVQKRAQHLIAQNYKKASANFYLGESYFAKKNYQDAVYHFKESWSLYGESEFMPVLLLHSAKSLEHLGKTSEANTFYQALVDSYPSSDEAKEATQKLKGN